MYLFRAFAMSSCFRSWNESARSCAFLPNDDAAVLNISAGELEETDFEELEGDEIVI